MRPASGGAPADAKDFWIWDPIDGATFSHPSECPVDDEALAKAKFIEKKCGPHFTKISAVKVLDRKGNIVMIARSDGSNHEVDKSRLLPWYEGLVVLQEIEGKRNLPGWFTSEVQHVLDKERIKYSKNASGLSAALYVEKRLVDSAVTGARVFDNDDKEWNYRREALRGDEKLALSNEGEDVPGFFKIRDITGYMPPWEAFCHERCGIYQDFYQVRWEHPFSEIDYSRVENGCSGVPGATWEPDECVPPHLDALRIREKRSWFKSKKEQESKRNDELLQQAAKRARTHDSQQAPPPSADRRPVRIARLRRDGKPLHQDVYRSKLGHDFAPEEVDQKLGNIRAGWPKQPSEYPPGYGAANPPGFCTLKCDCMDDQRPQQQWETHKAWLEDPSRSAAAQTSLDNLAEQTRFVTRRGEVSKMWYFQTGSSILGDQTHVRAALDLAAEIQKSIQEVLKDIPLAAISHGADPVRIPALAFLPAGSDYEPLSFALAADPPVGLWATIGVDDGILRALAVPPARPAPLKVEMNFIEGICGSVECRVSDKAAGSSPWNAATVKVVTHFNDVRRCQLLKNARIVLKERLSLLYSFEANTPKETSLGRWLEDMYRLLRMLRGSTVANVVKTEVHSTRPPSSARAF